MVETNLFTALLNVGVFLESFLSFFFKEMVEEEIFFFRKKRDEGEGLIFFSKQPVK